MSEESVKRYPKSRGTNEAVKFVKSFESPGIFRLLTISEINFIRDVLKEFSGKDVDEVDEALDLLKALKPLKTETVLRIIEETEYGSGHQDSD